MLWKNLVARVRRNMPPVSHEIINGNSFPLEFVTFALSLKIYVQQPEGTAHRTVCDVSMLLVRLHWSCWQLGVIFSSSWWSTLHTTPLGLFTAITAAELASCPWGGLHAAAVDDPHSLPRRHDRHSPPPAEKKEEISGRRCSEPPVPRSLICSVTE